MCKKPIAENYFRSLWFNNSIEKCCRPLVIERLSRSRENSRALYSSLICTSYYFKALSMFSQVYQLEECSAREYLAFFKHFTCSILLLFLQPTCKVGGYYYLHGVDVGLKVRDRCLPKAALGC